MYWKSSKYIFLNVCNLFGVTSKFHRFTAQVTTQFMIVITEH